jgi:hypothetical protein
MRLNISLAAIAATMVAAAPAVAQQQRTAAAEARGTILSPISLQNTAPLDFGTVAATNAAGTVSVDADTGVRSQTLGVVLVPSTFSRARFDGIGQASQSITLTLAQPVGNVLNSGLNTVTANLTLDQSGATSRSLPVSGAFTVYVGGTFGIAANQPNGLYTAPFTLTADYQ